MLGRVLGGAFCCVGGSEGVVGAVVLGCGVGALGWLAASPLRGRLSCRLTCDH